ncbi:putative membrane protein EpsK [Sporomusa ovata DSM 2662]|uniref:Membrane protein involved in the export of O-antigen, teichoic acid lipoteichoic acids n=1 Tax=Sporomusa ovata TaxID=2378 RepID=A0A0U1L4U9_9FIRM|nr:MATE family efflux transporter [Sporomusa ovata]EQB28394.1 putative membrane protein EpsK [Sporomusa ovata DSM 2662]CQR74718.1 unknown [Sporomusa ovata]
MGFQFCSNLITNFISLLLSAFIAIWITPLIINKLGAEAYGFIPLTQNLIGFFSVITIALSSVIGRFVTISVKQDKFEDAKEYINTYLYSSLAFSGGLIVPLILVSFFIDKIIEVPDYLIMDVRLALIISSLLFLIAFVGSIFAVGPFCANRLDVNSGINVINIIARTLLTVGLLSLFPPKIWYVNLASLISGIIAFLLSISFFKKFFPWLKVNIDFFVKPKLYELITAGAWSSINQIGIILFLQVDLIVANLMVGPKGAGIYAAIMQLPILLRLIAGNVASVFSPLIISFYAQNDMKKLVEYTNRAVKINGLILSLPLGLVCGMSESFLSVWLGSNFGEYKWLLLAMSVHLVISLTFMPLYYIPTAVNKLRLPALVTVVLGLVNFLLAFVLTGPGKLGLYGIVLAGAIVLTIKNSLFTPLYSAFITNQPFYTYYSNIIQPLIGAVITVILGLIVQLVIPATNWKFLSIDLVIVSIIYLFLTLVFFVNSEERKMMMKYLVGYYQAGRKIWK